MRHVDWLSFWVGAALGAALLMIIVLEIVKRRFR